MQLTRENRKDEFEVRDTPGDDCGTDGKRMMEKMNERTSTIVVANVDDEEVRNNADDENDDEEFVNDSADLQQ